MAKKYVITIGNEDDLDTLITQPFKTVDDTVDEITKFIREGNHHCKRKVVYQLDDNDTLIRLFTLDEWSRE